MSDVLIEHLSRARDELLHAITAAEREDTYEVADHLDAATDEIRKVLDHLKVTEGKAA